MAVKIKRFIKDHKELTLTSSGSKHMIFCSSCCVTINYTENTVSGRISEHLRSEAHQKSKSSGEKQMTMVEIVQKAKSNDTFHERLTRALLSANIPLAKLKNIQLKSFLEEEMNRKLPTPDILRRNQVPVISQSVLAKIRDMISEKNVYLIIDETQDPDSRQCVNVLVGILDGTPRKPMLINVEFVQKTNYETIQSVILNSCSILWPGKNRYPELHLILSDQATYMTKAVEEMKKIQVMYPNLHHITCLAHAINRVADSIQKDHILINKWVINWKKFFANSSKRKMIFKKKTKLKLPPVPVVCRWGTWLNSVNYHMNNYEKLKTFILDFQSQDKSKVNSIKILKKIASGSNQMIAKNLYNMRKLVKIPLLIRKLENQRISMEDQLNVLEDLKEIISDKPTYLKKLNDSLAKNPDLIPFTSVIDPRKRIEREYCPLVTVDVERSFSRFKDLLTSKRRRLTEDNIKHHMIIGFNSFLP